MGVLNDGRRRMWGGWREQVQRAGTGRAVGGAGDWLGVGHVCRVQDEWWGGWKPCGGADGWSSVRLVVGELVVRSEHGIECCGYERGGDWRRQHDLERGKLRDKQVNGEECISGLVPEHRFIL